jgi:hypothetical protein
MALYLWDYGGHRVPHLARRTYGSSPPCAAAGPPGSVHIRRHRAMARELVGTTSGPCSAPAVPHCTPANYRPPQKLIHESPKRHLPGIFPAV